MDEISVPAEGRGNFQKQQAAVERMRRSKDEATLWYALLLFQSYPFRTVKGLEFTYTIRGGEMFVSRKDKSITKATVELAFQRALSMGRNVSGPKKLRVFGASYLYPIFLRIGVIRSADGIQQTGEELLC